MEKVLIIGCGNIGRRVARLILGQGGEVAALARSQQSADQLKEMGVVPILGSLDAPEDLAALPTAGATVFYFAPPPGGGHGDPRMKNFCTSIEPGEEPSRVIYISTSGVYGDCGGEWVNEDRSPHPETARAKRRLDAETTLRDWARARGVTAVTLRVTGIYGPEYTPLVRLEGGHPVLRREEAPYTNRIHADDLARICFAAAEKGEAGEIFNISDGHPSTMTDYFLQLADAFGLPRPPEVTMEEARRVMNPMMLSYLTESRRLDSSRMIERLGIELRYPDVESALPDLVPQVKALLARMERGDEPS